MGRFEPDFEGVNAFTPIYDKGQYELIISSHSTTATPQREEAASDAKKKSYVVVDGVPLSVGVRVQFKMIGKVDSRGNVDNELEGERVESTTLWLHNKGSLEMTKRFLMNLFGFDKEQEKEFNQFYKEQGFGFDVEANDEGGFDVELGRGWSTIDNKRIRAQLDRGPRTNADGTQGDEEQKFSRFMPAGVAAAV